MLFIVTKKQYFPRRRMGATIIHAGFYGCAAAPLREKT
jgi:hypothetical protein